MALSVRDILSVPGLALRLLAGGEAADRPVRWVHSSELEDPTPWLKGGELLLTTGAGVGSTPAKQRAYVQRLADAGLAGLGFGSGFSYRRVPKALVTAAEVAGTSSGPLTRTLGILDVFTSPTRVRVHA